MDELGDLPLEPAALDRRHDAALRLDFREQPFGLPLERIGQRLHIVRSAERIGDVRHAGLVRQDLLRPERDAHRFLGRQGQRLVERVGVE